MNAPVPNETPAQITYVGCLSRYAWLQIHRKGLLSAFLTLMQSNPSRAEVDAWLHKRKVWGFLQSPFAHLDLEHPYDSPALEARRLQAVANLEARAVIDGWFTSRE